MSDPTCDDLDNIADPDAKLLATVQAFADRFGLAGHLRRAMLSGPEGR